MQNSFIAIGTWRCCSTYWCSYGLGILYELMTASFTYSALFAPGATVLDGMRRAA
jgi:hypothetical protein